MEKPHLEDFPGWFQFMKAYRRWVEFENKAGRSYNEFEHVSNILKQIDGIEAFQVVHTTIADQMKLIENNVITFPDEYQLKNIGLTIHELLPDEAKSILPTYNGTSKKIINKVNTRNQQNNGRKYHGKKDLYLEIKDDKMPDRTFSDVICPACGKAGHHIKVHGCDEYAIDEKLKQYKKNNKNKIETDTVLQVYDAHQQQRRKKNTGKTKRNLLRKKLRAAKMELQDDVNKYKEVKAFYIKAFKREYENYDLVDPRQDHNLEIKEYDILESEPESDEEPDIITEEV